MNPARDADPAPIQLSTRRIPPSRRHAAWDDAVARTVGPLVTDFGADFEGRLDVRSLAGLPATRMIHNARAARRGRREIEMLDPGRRHVVLQLSGRSTLNQQGRDAVLFPGDLAMLDSGRPAVLQFEQKNAQVWVGFPRDILIARAGGAAPRLATTVQGASAVMLAAMIRTAFGSANLWSAAQAEAIRDGLVGLVAATWCAPEAEAKDQPGALPPLVHVIQNHILANLHLASLSPDSIAKAHGVSVRQLHRLFRHMGTSVGHWIRRARLDRCAADLLDESRLAASVTEIGFAWGFNDSAHFSRVFKAEFGQAPTRYRLSRMSSSLPSPLNKECL